MNLLLTSPLLGQAFFEADGKQIPTGSITKIYNFSYAYKDSLKLFLDDSTVQYFNTNNTITKTETYSEYFKTSVPTVQIHYFGTQGRDSVSKIFHKGKLYLMYKYKYDKIGRIIYYGIKEFNTDSSYNRSSERFYEYRDSSISTGKIQIQTVFFVNDAYGEKKIIYKVITEYDKKKRKIKETQESKANDPLAQITIYTYNEKDSLISKKIDGMETLNSIIKRTNTKCDTETEYSFLSTDYISIKQLTYQLLTENIKLLTTDECEYFLNKLIATEKQTRLTIIKHKPYYEGRRVIFTTTKKYDKTEKK